MLFRSPLTLGACFPEIRQVSSGCRHGPKCRHVDEPGCTVIRASKDGSLHPDRYESYVRILMELEDSRAYTKKQGRPRHDPSEAEYKDEYEEDA